MWSLDLSQLFLNADSEFRLLLPVAGQILQNSKSVKHEKMGNSPFGSGPGPDAAGKPVVAVDQIVAPRLTGSEHLEFSEEIRQVRKNGHGIQMIFATPFQMNKSYIGSQFSHTRTSTILPSREYVDTVSSLGQLAGELPDIDAHPAGILGAQLSNGTGMDAQHGDAKWLVSQAGFLTRSSRSTTFIASDRLRQPSAQWQV